MELNKPVSQVEFSKLVGTTKQAISKHVAAGVLNEGAPAGEWLKAYCKKLREAASGHVPTDARERRDLAQARESEANAAMKERELWKQDGVLLEYEAVRAFVMDQINQVQNEMTRTVNGIVNAIESRYSISVDREISDNAIDAARRSIGLSAEEFEAPTAGSGDNLDTAA